MKRGWSGGFAEGLGRARAEYPSDSGRRDTVPFCDLPEALALAVVALDGGIIQCERISADMLAFKAGAPHAGAHPLYH